MIYNSIDINIKFNQRGRGRIKVHPRYILDFILTNANVYIGSQEKNRVRKCNSGLTHIPLNFIMYAFKILLFLDLYNNDKAVMAQSIKST